MDLHQKSFGQGHPLLILHGLFGSSDNWASLGKQFAEDYKVYLVDLRNHGRSPHTDKMDYPLMAEDVAQLITDEGLGSAMVMGHSMGGKVAMQLALRRPELVSKLVVVDMGVKAYPGGHEAIFDALLALEPATLESRTEADEQLANKIPEFGIRQFLLKNLKRHANGGFSWKMNLTAIHQHYSEILVALQSDEAYRGPTLFIRGGRSDYIQDADWDGILASFPRAVLETVPDAGHWVHAEAPEAVYELVRAFAG